MTTGTPRKTTWNWKKYLYLTLECRNCANLFSKSIDLKRLRKLNVQWGKARTISHCGTRCPKCIWLCQFYVAVLQRTANKCTKIQNALAEPLFYSLNLLFGDVLVALVVCENSLIRRGIKGRERETREFTILFLKSTTNEVGRSSPIAIHCWACKSIDNNNNNNNNNNSNNINDKFISFRYS